MSILFTPRSALAAPAPDPQTRARANNVTESAALASTRNWIVSDLDLPTSGSRTFDISGKAWVAGYVIVLDSEAFTAPPSATSTVYLGLVRDGNGDVTDVTLATTAHISGDYVVLGDVTTDGSNVTVRDYDNRSPDTQEDPVTAPNVAFDPDASGLSSTDVDGALKELASQVGPVTATDVAFDPGASGLSSTDVDGALKELAGKGGAIVNYYTSSGTYTKPTGAVAVYVEACGGGGGGSGGGQNTTVIVEAQGKGGAGGCFLSAIFRADELVNTPISVTVGAGGNGGAGTSSGPGNAAAGGGASSFGSYLTAPGGQAAIGAAPSTAHPVPADSSPINVAGAAASSGAPGPTPAGLRCPGGGASGATSAGVGGRGFQSKKGGSIVVSNGGAGGWGDGGNGGRSSGNPSDGTAGSPGNFPGGGGGGGGQGQGTGRTGGNGGKGGDGYVLVITWIGE